jgi:hypothetical protein
MWKTIGLSNGLLTPVLRVACMVCCNWCVLGTWGGEAFALRRVDGFRDVLVFLVFQAVFVKPKIQGCMWVVVTRYPLVPCGCNAAQWFGARGFA